MRAAIALAGALAMAPVYASCPLPASTLQQGAVQASWAVDKPPIVVGRHFTIQVRLCPADAVLARVDATMPAHRHGMNYRPTVQPLGDGRWHVEGLMFHMPGAWELRLDVQSAGHTVSLRETVALP